MKYYEKLLECGCFNRKDLEQLTGSSFAATDLIYDYQKKGYIERVKRDLYAVISLETKQPVMNRYQIASALFSDACVSHHSAFEVYGYANQVFYECYVATQSRFLDFEYNGVSYHRVERKKDTDVIKMGKTVITGLEQTVVDSIKDLDKIVGFEEVVRCLFMVPGLNERKFLECLQTYNNGFLYQKCGYLLESLQNEIGISNEFLTLCEKNSSAAKRYVTKENSHLLYNERWKLYVPESLQILVNKGVDEDAYL